MVAGASSRTMDLIRVIMAWVGPWVAAVSPFTATPPSHFHLAGDYVLGGLFSLHAEPVTRPHLSYIRVPVCKEYKIKLVGYSYLQAMRFAVEEINNSSSLLPGVSLGYEMVDICYLTNTVHPLLYFLSNNQSQLEIAGNYTAYLPRVVAVIGPDSSDAAVSIAYLLSQYLIPQITYSATTEVLGNPQHFPVAFRTIPSAEQHISVLLKLLRRFRWNWVMVLSTDDDYGQQNLQLLRSQATSVCIAFQETIPVQETDSGASGQSAREKLQALVAKIKSHSSKVAVVLSTELPLLDLFDEVLIQNVTGVVWIAAEAWSIEPSIHSIPNLSRVGTILGVAVQDVTVPGLNDFRVRVQSETGEGIEGPPVGLSCNQECQRCHSMAEQFNEALIGTGDRIDFNVYAAVHVIAHSLHRLLGCNATGCSKRTIYPWQLLQEVKQVSFSLLNTTIGFDEKGDPPNGFEVIQWQWDVPGKPFRRIGSYNSIREKLRIHSGRITWHTSDNRPPKSICSERCDPGYIKKQIGSLSCCFECTPCEAGTFHNRSDMFACQTCPPEMWSNPGKEECFEKQVLYLMWNAPISIVLMFFSVLGLLGALGILFLFVCHSDSPVVRSAGGNLCFLMIFSIIVGLCSVFFYIGRPTKLKCVFRQIIFSLCFTVYVACITVRSFQIICVFKMAAWMPRAYDLWKKYDGQHFFVAVVIVLKVVTLAVNIYFFHPVPVLTSVPGNPAVLVLMCSYRPTMALNSVFDMFFSFLSFSFAYMGKALPKNYNEAKYITLCMTSFFASWVVLFLIMSLSDGITITVFEGGTILFNLLNTCVGYFGPKCYIIIFRPERNTKAFFQTAIQSYTMRQE